MHTTTIIITNEQYQELRKRSFAETKTLSELVREALDRYSQTSKKETTPKKEKAIKNKLNMPFEL